MGIFDFLGREVKESKVAPTLVVSPGQPRWTPRDYASFSKEAYQKNIVAYACVNRIADAVASVGWEAWRGDTQVTESPLLDLIENPNPDQSGSEFMQAKISYLLLSGNGYDEQVVLGGEPREIYALRPDRMKVARDKNGEIIQYEYTGVTGQKVTWDVDDGFSDINHTRLFNPMNDDYGQSPVETAAYAVDQHNEAMSWMQALLQNSAIPSGALTTDADKGELTDEQFNRLKAQIEEQYAGARNAGRPMLLEGGLGWQSMAMSPDDMAVIDTKNSAARDIALAFGVPPMLLGIPGDNTYANYAEARLAFWEDTVIPLLNFIAEDWSNWLGAQFGDLVLKPDLDQVPAIVDKRQTLWAMAEQSTVLTTNEKRELMGFPPVTDGDTILIPSNLIPIDLDGAAAIKLAGYDGETK